MTWLRTKESAASSGLTHRVLFTRGANHGLGSVYVYADRATKNEFEYPGYNKFSDEGGKAIKGNLIYFIETGDAAENQADCMVRPQHSLWFDAGRAVKNQSVNRGFRLVHLGRAGKRSQQYSWPRRSSERIPKRVLGADGRRDQTARPGQEHSKVSARGRWSQG